MLGPKCVKKRMVAQRSLKEVDRILATRDKDESTHTPLLLKALGEVTSGTGSRPMVGDLGSCSEHSCF